MTRNALIILLFCISLTAQAAPAAAQIAPAATPSSKPGPAQVTDDYVNQRMRDDAQPDRSIETVAGQHEYGTGRSFDALVAAVLATTQPE